MATGSRASGHGEEEEEAARHPWGRGCGSRVTAPGEEEEEVVGHGEEEEKVASLATGDEEEKVAPPLTRCQGKRVLSGHGEERALAHAESSQVRFHSIRRGRPLYWDSPLPVIVQYQGIGSSMPSLNSMYIQISVLRKSDSNSIVWAPIPTSKHSLREIARVGDHGGVSVLSPCPRRRSRSYRWSWWSELEPPTAFS